MAKKCLVWKAFRSKYWHRLIETAVWHRLTSTISTFLTLTKNQWSLILIIAVKARILQERVSISLTIRSSITKLANLIQTAHSQGTSICNKALCQAKMAHPRRLLKWIRQSTASIVIARSWRQVPLILSHHLHSVRKTLLPPHKESRN